MFIACNNVNSSQIGFFGRLVCTLKYVLGLHSYSVFHCFENTYLENFNIRFSLLNDLLHSDYVYCSGDIVELHLALAMVVLNP